MHSKQRHDEPVREASLRRFSMSGIPWEAIGFLVLTITIALVWSHARIASDDELLVLNTDSAPSFVAMIQTQLRHPTAVEPIVSHLCVYASMKLFGVGTFGARLPSLCGYVLMQVCLFSFVRRIAGDRAAVCAFALPALVGIFRYATEARPYALLLGFSALALVCWQKATRDQEGRTGALLAMALAIALAINTHYYGVLFLVPLAAAELVRSLERRRLDWPMIAGLTLGACGLFILFPFLKGAAQYKVHYYDSGPLEFHFITHAYLWLLVGYLHMSIRLQHAISAALLVLLCGLGWNFYKRRSLYQRAMPKAEVVLLVALVMLPCFGYVLARLVTKVIEGRYILPALIGMIASFAILLAPVLRNQTVYRTVLGFLFLGIAIAGVLRIRKDELLTRDTWSGIRFSPAIRAELDRRPNEPVYVTNVGVFLRMRYYMPYPELRGRMRLLYSREREMEAQQREYGSITALNLKANMTPEVVSYESVAAQPGEHIFGIIQDPAIDWVESTLVEDHAEIKSLGAAFGSDVSEVQFPHSHRVADEPR